jgi:hypothetical protein
MTQVIGPIDRDVWITMRMLNSSINYMKAANDNDRYAEGIRKETELYEAYKGDVKRRAA